MGLLRQMLGKEKVDLIRQLLIERVTNDFAAQKAGFTRFQVNQLSDSDLLSSTEAAIVYIVETFFKLQTSGVSELDAINRIEQHRLSLGRGLGGPPSSFLEFINYRVSVEHQGPDLAESHIELCAIASEHLFSYLDDKGEASHSIKSNR